MLGDEERWKANSRIRLPILQSTPKLFPPLARLALLIIAGMGWRNRDHVRLGVLMRGLRRELEMSTAFLYVVALFANVSVRKMFLFRCVAEESSSV